MINIIDHPTIEEENPPTIEEENPPTIEDPKEELDNPPLHPIEIQLNKLRGFPQPHQRTPEWYLFRHNLITASNAYKAFGTVSQKNSLIYEKCQPMVQPIPWLPVEDPDQDPDPTIKRIVLGPSPMKPVQQMVNTNSPMHWGQKYEPLSVRLYEELYQTKIEDFGCIQHPLYSFLGASPDGINVDPVSPLYGRMLEIKNPVSREITGTPKHEYWVQMQLQMEVCDLDTCDFWETKFVESEQPFSCKELHGTFVMFSRDGVPKYVYDPVDDIEAFEAAEGYEFIKYIHWKLENSNCLLVHRDRAWFQKVLPEMQKLWDTVLKERVSGYEHRAPKRRATMSVKKEGPGGGSLEEGKCFHGLL
jgi:putative phage-type endonuclease